MTSPLTKKGARAAMTGSECCNPSVMEMRVHVAQVNGSPQVVRTKKVERVLKEA